VHRSLQSYQFFHEPNAHDILVRSKFRLYSVVLACFGSLVVILTGAIIAMNFLTSVAVFSQMLSQIVVRGADGLELALRNHLDAAEYQADFIIENIRTGNVSLDRPDLLAEFASGSLAAAPQISALVVADAQGRMFGARRDPFGNVERQWLDVQPNSQLALVDAEMRTRKKPYWGQPTYSEPLKVTLMNYRAPIWRGDEYRGYGGWHIDKITVRLGKRTERATEFERFCALWRR